MWGDLGTRRSIREGPWSGRSREIVDVLDVDPDLAADLSPSDRLAAGRVARARLRRLPFGELDLPGPSPAPAGLGLLVLSGVLGRELIHDGRRSLELLGEGDLIRPWSESVSDMVGTEVRWRVLASATAAELDARFTAAIAPFPALHGQFLDRAVQRSRALAFQALIRGYPAVDDRLVLLLRHLAQRWGKVTPAGVRVPLPLTHDMLAELIGVRRPSVTGGLGRLADAGVITRERGSVTLVRAAVAGQA